jgi:hypothetical protein
MELNPYRIIADEASFEDSYADFLAALWEDLDDLLDSHYGARVRLDDDRMRMRLAELRLRLTVMMDQAAHTPRSDRDGAALHATRLRTFATELLRLLDFDTADARWHLGCGATMVLAQNRILDEARWVAAAQ